MAAASILRWILAKAFKLPPRLTGDVITRKDIATPMRDGIELRADLIAPRGTSSGPVVLIRSPYGRNPVFAIMGGLLAERGFHVVLQSVRGTWDSGGIFDPMRQEKEDGADTLDWVRAQPWFGGKLFTFGGSYLGNVQYAMVDAAPDKVDGLVLQVTLSNFRDELRAFGGFTLGGMLSWAKMMQAITNYVPGQKMGRPDVKALEPHFEHLPLGTIDQAALGETLPWWQNWINHAPGDPWWNSFDYSGAREKLNAPAMLIGGWQDIFLPHQVRDFLAMRAAGKDVWLTIGPWGHAAPGGMIESLRHAVSLFTAISKKQTPFHDRDRVRLFVQGAKQWRDYSDWPPPGAQSKTLYLRVGGRLDAAAPERDEGSSRFTYDPADPTPALHGPALMGGAKLRDMSALETRADTISFTSDPLEQDIEVIGPVSVDLAIRSDREHTDFFACLCEVDRKGRPIQICDGYLRLTPGSHEADSDGIRRIKLECWPTAHRFANGNRLRLIVASGAHPRFARNLGTGEPLGTATEMMAAQQEVLHGSSVCLSVMG